MNCNRKRQQLQQILKRMNVPAERQMITEVNLRWLLRNAMPYNKDHPDLFHSLELIKELL